MRVYFIAITALMLIALASCKDSLGYDPNVQISEIVKDTVIKPPDDNSPTTFTVDSVKYVFAETFKHNNRYFETPWAGRFTKKKIVMDTSSAEKTINVDLIMETTSRDDDYRMAMRVDRVVGFELNITSLIENKRILLDGTIDNGKWFKLIIRKLDERNTKEFSGQNINASLSLMDVNFQNGIIRLLLESEIPKISPTQTKRFNGIIDIYFKK